MIMMHYHDGAPHEVDVRNSVLVVASKFIDASGRCARARGHLPDFCGVVSAGPAVSLSLVLHAQLSASPMPDVRVAFARLAPVPPVRDIKF